MEKSSVTLCPGTTVTLVPPSFGVSFGVKAWEQQIVEKVADLSLDKEMRSFPRTPGPHYVHQLVNECPVIKTAGRMLMIVAHAC
jgi:hypothetical protein